MSFTPSAATVAPSASVSITVKGCDLPATVTKSGDAADDLTCTLSANGKKLTIAAASTATAAQTATVTVTDAASESKSITVTIASE